MKVTLVTGSWAKRYVAGESVVLDVPERSTVADVLKASALPLDEAGMALTGGRPVTQEHVLSDGDVLKIYPVIIGG